MRYAVEFYSSGDLMWRKDPHGFHKTVVPQEHRLFLLSSAHNDVGHHGFYATSALLSERYWWPAMAQDIAWYIRTCHLCQLRKDTTNLYSPYRRLPSSFIRQSPYGYDAPHTFRQIQIYRPGSILPHALARMGDASKRNSQIDCALHPPEHHLSLGHST